MASLRDPKILQLFEERYSKQLQNVAKKNRYLEPTGNWEDLYHDLVVSVFLATADSFDMGKVSYSDDERRAFNARLNMRLQHELSTLKTRHYTDKATNARENTRSGDEPMGDEEGASLFEQMPNEDQYDFGGEIDLANAISKMPGDIGKALRILVERADRAGVGQAFEDVQAETGLSHKRLMNFLVKDKNFIDALPGAEKYV